VYPFLLYCARNLRDDEIRAGRKLSARECVYFISAARSANNCFGCARANGFPAFQPRKLHPGFEKWTVKLRIVGVIFHGKLSPGLQVFIHLARGAANKKI